MGVVADGGDVQEQSTEAAGAGATGGGAVRAGPGADTGAAGGQAADGAADAPAPGSGTPCAAFRPRCGPVWARHNATVARAGAAGARCGSLVAPPGAEAGGLSDSGEVTGKMPGKTNETPCCRGCGVALRPAVLMFGDDDPALLERLRVRGDAYQEWEEQMEAAVSCSGGGGGGGGGGGSGGGDSGGDGDGDGGSDSGGGSGGDGNSGGGGLSLVILELGCGLRVPSVRGECEAVLRDTRARGGAATLVRVNAEPEAARVDGLGHDDAEATVSIVGTALSVLRLIDAAIADDATGERTP